ncbi:sulfurtransferase [Nakamurella leprariae]|uniref:Sulfurtransferase n=1 Tax=Nakamurella leprariae TaxID=2803911 RepID=A0A939C2L7_9ACTN|nr:sulfurtransferase [Nakamurella leprariae]MBM9468414.1 sulfurtransferase [Nakamurella leprariae]
MTEASSSAEQTAPRPVFVSPADLASELDGSTRPHLLDVRWVFGGPPGRPEYLEAHLPGAVYVDLDTELSTHGAPEDGRHPLPDVADLQVAVRRWGLRAGEPVVVYDDWKGMAAGRAWWLLRWTGIADVRILDGGLAAWRAAGLPVEAGDVTADAGDVELQPGQMPTLDPDGAAALARAGVLLDARPAVRYRGEQEALDPRPGHIPGARSAPTADNVSADGTMLPADRLRARFAGLGVVAGGDVPVGVYCGSGVTAAHTVAVLADQGIDAALYPGSWSQWSNLPERPAVTGSEPG